MFKKCKIVILPTKKKASILYLEHIRKLNNPGELTKILPGEKGYHLYILSDEEIKEDNWYLDDTNVIRQSVTSDKNYWSRRSNYKKIIASTDSLTMTEGYDVNTDMPIKYNFPSIPQLFIDKYVSEYNKGNKIEEVMVEYEQYDGYPPVSFMSDALKVHYLDNTIYIKSTKDSWDRKEMINILKIYLQGKELDECIENYL
jgi:hypothetical protein